MKMASMQKYVTEIENLLAHELQQRRLISSHASAINPSASVAAEAYAKTSIIDLESLKLEHAKNARKTAGMVLVGQALDRSSRKRLARAFRKWTCEAIKYRTASDQMDFARHMASQLQSTREKLNSLKTQLREGGFINDEDAIRFASTLSPVEHGMPVNSNLYTPQNPPPPGRHSSEVSFWHVSDDDDEFDRASSRGSY